METTLKVNIYGIDVQVPVEVSEYDVVMTLPGSQTILIFALDDIKGIIQDED